MSSINSIEKLATDVRHSIERSVGLAALIPNVLYDCLYEASNRDYIFKTNTEDSGFVEVVFKNDYSPKRMCSVMLLVDQWGRPRGSQTLEIDGLRLGHDKFQRPTLKKASLCFETRFGTTSVYDTENGFSNGIGPKRARQALGYVMVLNYRLSGILDRNF